MKASKAVFLVFLITLSSCIVNAEPVKAIPETIVVPDDYANIGWAVGNATEGDTVYVKKGSYYENLVINKSLSLIGEDPETTIIDGTIIDGTLAVGEVDIAITITHDYVKVAGFTIRNFTWKGIPYEPHGTLAGVHLVNADYCDISGNNIISNARGIWIKSSHYNSITGNYIADNARGIELDLSSHNNIIGNNMNTNRVGNFILRSCDYTRISDNNITKSEHGIICSDYSHKEDPSDYLSIIGNNITSNSVVGIQVKFSSNCTIVGNDLANNDKGVWLYAATENIQFYHNNFINNTVQVDTFLEYDSFWDNGKEGNYWSNYTGTDEDGDGIGDTPHIIDANNIDHYPLMNQWIPPTRPLESFPTTWIVAMTAIITVGAIALLLYFRRTKKQREVE